MTEQTKLFVTYIEMPGPRFVVGKLQIPTLELRHGQLIGIKWSTGEVDVYCIYDKAEDDTHLVVFVEGSSEFASAVTTY